MIPGTPTNFRPLWGLLLVLAGLCAILFFACPFGSKKIANKEIRTQHFSPVRQQGVTPKLTGLSTPSPKPSPAVKIVIPPVQSCTLCAEPTLRYLHAVQAPFPENRQTYEAPKILNNLPLANAYSPARPAAYPGAYEKLHP